MSDGILFQVIDTSEKLNLYYQRLFHGSGIYNLYSFYHGLRQLQCKESIKLNGQDRKCLYFIPKIDDYFIQSHAEYEPNKQLINLKWIMKFLDEHSNEIDGISLCYVKDIYNYITITHKFVQKYEESLSLLQDRNECLNYPHIKI